VSIPLSNADERPITFSEEVIVAVDRLDSNQVATPVTVRLEGRVLPMDGGYLVEGSMDAEGSLVCSRCLVPVPWKVNDRYTVELRNSLGSDQEDVELNGADLDVVFIVNDQLDIDQRNPPDSDHEDVELNGADLDVVDPRWEGLQGLEGRPS